MNHLPTPSLLRLLGLLVSLVALLRPGQAESAPRVALVIGNAGYAAGPLPSCVNDAAGMEAGLRRLGFTVTRKTDQDRRGMVESIRAFGTQAKGASVALFYYSGHGMAVDGRNYLVPLGADLRRQGDVELEAVDVARVLNELSGTGARCSLMILDACRDNPLPAEFKDLQKGLIIKSGPEGSLVAFAASEGQTALAKADEPRSIYTDELLKNLETPGATLETVFKRTRVGVRQRTDGKQVPEERSKLLEDVVLTAGKPAVEPLGREARLLVVSTPPGAEVYLDGKPTGKVTPATLTLELGFAQSQVVELGLRLAGRKPGLQKTTAVRGEERIVTVTLQAETPGNETAGGEIVRNTIDGAEEVRIPGGEFLMGSDPAELDALWKRFRWPKELRKYAADEAPRHPVRMSEFWLYQKEVTVAQFRQFSTATGRAMPEIPKWGWLETHPVVNVSWDDAQAYCVWLSAKSGKRYRLPTEAEWEYAARGGKTGLNGQLRWVFGWGDDLPKGKAGVGNVADETSGLKYPVSGYVDGYKNAAPVGSFGANGFRLFDLEGNVSEWCNDWYGEDYYLSSPPANPSGAEAGQMRVVRGGSWQFNPYDLRLTSRSGSIPDFRHHALGFRAARTK